MELDWGYQVHSSRASAGHKRRRQRVSSSESIWFIDWPWGLRLILYVRYPGINESKNSPTGTPIPVPRAIFASSLKPPGAAGVAETEGATSWIVKLEKSVGLSGVSHTDLLYGTLDLVAQQDQLPPAWIIIKFESEHTTWAVWKASTAGTVQEKANVHCEPVSPGPKDPSPMANAVLTWSFRPRAALNVQVPQEPSNTSTFKDWTTTRVGILFFVGVGGFAASVTVPLEKGPSYRDYQWLTQYGFIQSSLLLSRAK